MVFWPRFQPETTQIRSRRGKCLSAALVPTVRQASSAIVCTDHQRPSQSDFSSLQQTATWRWHTVAWKVRGYRLPSSGTPARAVWPPCIPFYTLCLPLCPLASTTWSHFTDRFLCKNLFYARPTRQKRAEMIRKTIAIWDASDFIVPKWA